MSFSKAMRTRQYFGKDLNYEQNIVRVWQKAHPLPGHFLLWKQLCLATLLFEVLQPLI